MLTWVSVYWFSRAGPAASVRIYYENTQAKVPYGPWSSVPCGLSYFPQELTCLPKSCVSARSITSRADNRTWLQVGAPGRKRRIRVGPRGGRPLCCARATRGTGVGSACDVRKGRACVWGRTREARVRLSIAPPRRRLCHSSKSSKLSIVGIIPVGGARHLE